MKKLASVLIISTTLLTSGITAGATPPASDLNAYLTSINMTQTQLAKYMNEHGDSLKYYDSVDELKAVLGKRLTQESLDEFLIAYGYTEQELKEIAMIFDDMDENASLLDTYYFVNDLGRLAELDQESEDEFPTIDEIAVILEALEFSSSEVKTISNHIKTAMKNDPTSEEKLKVLARRMLAVENKMNESDFGPTSGQIAEMVNIVQEIQRTLQIDVKFYFVQDGVKTPYSYKQLLEIIEEPEGDILFEVYDLNGKFLGDSLIQLSWDWEEEFPEEIEKAIKNIANAKITIHTENGGQLPKTGNHQIELAMAGLLLMLGAFAIRRQVRKVEES